MADSAPTRATWLQIAEPPIAAPRLQGQNDHHHAAQQVDAGNACARTGRRAGAVDPLRGATGSERMVGEEGAAVDVMAFESRETV
jgi:hypothetical protein